MTVHDLLRLLIFAIILGIVGLAHCPQEIRRLVYYAFLGLTALLFFINQVFQFLGHIGVFCGR
jgi:hypothetical protein